jgi:phage-related protein
MDFTFNGVNSKTHGLKVRDSTHLSSPQKNVESIEIPGRTGNLVIDDGTFQNKKIKIVCYLDCTHSGNLAVKLKDIYRWLQSPIGYQDLTFSDGCRFKAYCSGSIDVSEVFKDFVQISIQFDSVEVDE